jgi:PAS domain S-box-containing protein
MGGRIARAVRALQEPALELGRGASIQVPPLGIREVNEVGEALTKASLLLQSTRSELADNEAQLRSIVESAMDAIIAVDARQVIVMFNPAAAVMFDCPAGRAIGMPLTRFIPERFHAHNVEIFQRQEAQQQGPAHASDGMTGVTVGLRMGGEEFPAEVSFSSVRKSGGVLHTLIIRDVTNRVRAYKALERSNLDLQQFAYVASHDLKTPLRSIGGFVQLLQRNHAGQLDEKALMLIQRTMGAVRRLEQLTEDLLSYARIEAEVRQFEPVDMVEVANDVVHLLDAAIRGSGARVTVNPLPPVHGDRTQLAQLLMNLVGNSIKYCRDAAPEVDISAERGDREWIFSVRDNGIGIAARHRDKVFEVFKRLHSQNEYPGTGIGLAICRRVVEGHGGRIWVKNDEGPGTTFSFTLPDHLPGNAHEA